MFTKSFNKSYFSTHSNLNLNWVQWLTGFLDNNARHYSTGRLTNDQKNSYVVTKDLHNIIIGCSLGDLNINKQSKTSRLRFKQGLNHIEYLNHLFELFSGYCNVNEPKRYKALCMRAVIKLLLQLYLTLILYLVLIIIMIFFM